MESGMRVTCAGTEKMEKVFFTSLMEEYTRATGVMMRCMVMEPRKALISTKASGVAG